MRPQPPHANRRDYRRKQKLAGKKPQYRRE